MIKLLLRLCNGFLFSIIKKEFAVQKVRKYKSTITKNKPKKTINKAKTKMSGHYYYESMKN